MNTIMYAHFELVAAVVKVLGCVFGLSVEVCGVLLLRLRLCKVFGSCISSMVLKSCKGC